MTKEDIKRKLCSRKFWLAFTAMVSGLILALGGDAKTADTVCGCIMSVASVVAYIIAEGLTDAAGVQQPDVIWLDEDEKPPEDDETE